MSRPLLLPPVQVDTVSRLFIPELARSGAAACGEYGALVPDHRVCCTRRRPVFVPGYVRVVTLRGKMAHLLGPGSPPAGRAPALCSRTPGLSGCWHGTGSITERAHAASLPLCGGCEEQARSSR